MFQTLESSEVQTTQSCESLEYHLEMVKNLPWWLLTTTEEPRQAGPFFPGCRKHCWDGLSQGMLLLCFPSQPVTKPHPQTIDMVQETGI